jgi:hypothetical protein
MSIDVKELLDEDAFDPEKLFNEEEYSTLIINREGFSKKENNAADLVEGLLDKHVTREESEAIFSKLKDAHANQLLIDSIRSAQRVDEKAILAAACWESGLDFTNDFLFFVELACGGDFKLALEAITVVENCEGTIDENTLAKALQLTESAKELPKELAEDLISNIKQRTV